MSDNILSQQKKKLLADNGYCTIERSVENSILLEAQQSFFKIKKKVKSNQYPYYRIYDDYSLDKNLSGIEMTFHQDILTESIMRLIVSSKILEISKEILGEEIELELSRFHLTEGFSHVGNWHRDEKINHPMDSLQINIFLFDEKGLQVVDQSHKKEVAGGEEFLKKTPHISIVNSKWLNTGAGDVLVFDPAVLHRGISANPRANIHFRFRKKISKNKQIMPNYKDLVVPKDWINILENSPKAMSSSDLTPHSFKNDFKSISFRFLRKIIHTFIFFLPLHSKLYYYFNVWPNLKLRHLFDLKT
jgi:hypothetical protein